MSCLLLKLSGLLEPHSLNHVITKDHPHTHHGSGVLIFLKCDI